MQCRRRKSSALFFKILSGHFQQTKSVFSRFSTVGSVITLDIMRHLNKRKQKLIVLLVFILSIAITTVIYYQSKHGFPKSTIKTTDSLNLKNNQGIQTAVEIGSPTLFQSGNPDI